MLLWAKYISNFQFVLHFYIQKYVLELNGNVIFRITTTTIVIFVMYIINI